MSKFFDETMQGLLEAVEMEKGNNSMSDKEKKLIDDVVTLRKEQNISQNKL